MCFGSHKKTVHSHYLTEEETGDQKDEAAAPRSHREEVAQQGTVPRSRTGGCHDAHSPAGGGVWLSVTAFWAFFPILLAQ